MKSAQQSDYLEAQTVCWKIGFFSKVSAFITRLTGGAKYGRFFVSVATETVAGIELAGSTSCSLSKIPRNLASSSRLMLS